MADYTDAEFSGLLDQLAQLPVEDRASDLLKLLKTLLTKNVTVQDWNTLIRDIAPLYATMLGLNDCMVNLINKVQRELGIFTGSSDSALSRIIALEDGTRSLANDKFDKTGGTIDGPVIITKGLTVRGTNTAVTTEHLRVEDAVIEANAGAKSVNDIPNLSGYVIHIGNGAAYGIVYDKIAKSVKLGLVEKGADGNYQFESGEGQSVALRADTNDLIAGRLVVWNGNKNRLETKFQVAQDATRMTIVQRNTDGEVITAANPASDNAAVPKKYADERFVKSVAGTANATSVYIRNEAGVDAIVPLTHHYAQPWSVVQRGSGGVVKTGTAVEDSDAMPKKQVEDGFVAKVNNKPNIAYTTGNKGEAITTHISFNPTAWDLVTFDGFGCLRTSDPTGDDGRQCVNKQTADKTYVKKTTKGGGMWAYIVDGNDNQDVLGVDDGASAWSLARRGVNGVLKVGTPVSSKDAVNVEYLVAQLDAVTGAAPYFMHNVCITQTVDNVVNTVRVSLVCTQLARITSVAALRALIVQFNGGGDASDANTPVWHGACNMPPYNPSESIPDSTLVYSGYIGLWNDATLRAWGDTVYPGAAYGVTLDDTNWTVSDDVLNAVVGGTTA